MRQCALNAFMKRLPRPPNSWFQPPAIRPAYGYAVDAADSKVSKLNWERRGRVYFTSLHEHRNCADVRACKLPQVIAMFLWMESHVPCQFQESSILAILVTDQPRTLSPLG